MSVVCPDCRGQKAANAIMCGRPRGASEEELSCRLTVVPCQFCKGTGQVGEEAAERWREGRRRRDERVHKLGLTQEQYAHRLGISPGNSTISNTGACPDER